VFPIFKLFLNNRIIAQGQTMILARNNINISWQTMVDIICTHMYLLSFSIFNIYIYIYINMHWLSMHTILNILNMLKDS
jgi:hypothetical protein